MVEDMPKIKSPFVRKIIDGNYVVTPEIEEGYDWVFTDDSVRAIEKLDGTDVSILIQDGHIIGVWNRTERLPFFNTGKRHIIEGVLNSYERGYMNLLQDGQHFGELIGPKIQGNPYGLTEHLWIPFETYAQKHLAYKSWGKYPKTFEAISEWFKTLMPLFCLNTKGKDYDKPYVEGVVFTHPDGRFAKLRCDMFQWYTGKNRHKSNAEEKEEK